MGTLLDKPNRHFKIPLNLNILKTELPSLTQKYPTRFRTYQIRSDLLCKSVESIIFFKKSPAQNWSEKKEKEPKYNNKGFRWKQKTFKMLRARDLSPLWSDNNPSSGAF